MKKKPEFKIQNITHPTKLLVDYNDPLLRELVAHLRENRTRLREEWARRITDAQLLTAMRIGTALDLEEGLTYLNTRTKRSAVDGN